MTRLFARGQPSAQTSHRMFFFLSLISQVLVSVSSGDTCVFPSPDGNGQVIINRNDPVDQFVLGKNRCGSNYPCLCDPDSPNQVMCPYCFFLSQNDGVICAAAGEKTRYADESGDFLECECKDVSAADGFPEATCMAAQNIFASQKVETLDDGPPATIPTTATGTCNVTLDDNTIATFNAGQSLGDSVVTRCYEPEKFPCYCNPDLKTSLNPGYECPYCSFALEDGTLLCSRDNEIIAFNDGPNIIRQCTCQVNGPGQPVTSSCTTSPRANPADPPFVAPVAPPTVTPPVTSPSGITGDGTNCRVDGGSPVADGESFGTQVNGGECGTPDVWPSFCVAGGTIINGGSETVYTRYPYCVFNNTFTTAKVCAKDEGTVDFVNSSGAPVRCTCNYRDEGSETSCVPFQPASPVDAPVIPPVAPPVAAPAAAPANAPVAAPLAAPAAADPVAPPVAQPVASPVQANELERSNGDAAAADMWRRMVALICTVLFVF